MEIRGMRATTNGHTDSRMCDPIIQHLSRPRGEARARARDDAAVIDEGRDSELSALKKGKWNVGLPFSSDDTTEHAQSSVWVGMLVPH